MRWLGVSALTGEAEEQVLRHARGSCRVCGLSDRDGADLSFDGQLTAALAVADAAGADRFRLFAAGCTAFNLIPQSPHEEQAVAGVATVNRLLTAP